MPDPRGVFDAALRAHPLDPALARYFGAIPPAMHGRGEGIFSRIGTRRRWLRVVGAPLFRMLERRGVVMAGWHEDVPFTVVNREHSGVDRRGVRTSERRIQLEGSTWTMRDAMRSLPRAGGRGEGGIVDVLGSPALIAATFAVTSPAEDTVVLDSRRVEMRIGSRALRIPGWCAPRVRLVETRLPHRADDSPADGTPEGAAEAAHAQQAPHQQVTVTIDLPVIGRVYEYAGGFTYRLETRTPPGENT